MEMIEYCHVFLQAYNIGDSEMILNIFCAESPKIWLKYKVW
jgi:hypothetical protein